MHAHITCACMPTSETVLIRVQFAHAICIVYASPCVLIILILCAKSISWQQADCCAVIALFSLPGSFALFQDI